jgi:hypothetical protein
MHIIEQANEYEDILADLFGIVVDDDEPVVGRRLGQQVAGQ